MAIKVLQFRYELALTKMPSSTHRDQREHPDTLTRAKKLCTSCHVSHKGEMTVNAVGRVYGSVQMKEGITSQGR